MDVTIRRVRADEAMALKALRLAALADAPTAFGSTYAGEAGRTEQFWRELAAWGATGEARVMFVADRGDELVGLAGGYRPEPFTGAIELVSMWVHPDARHHGVAIDLVDAVVDWADTAGVGVVELCVTESNRAATALYERCGFGPTGGCQPLPSDPSLDEVRMRRLLPRDPWAKPTLSGSLVTLRPISAADADAMWEMVNDPEGNALTGTTATFTREQIADWCTTRAAQRDRLDLAVVERATGDVAGEAVLNQFDGDAATANFRIALRGPAWYGRGLGTEATRLLVAHGLGTVGLRTITLSVLATNRRAQRAYDKAGFRRTGERWEDDATWVLMEIDRP